MRSLFAVLVLFAASGTDAEQCAPGRAVVSFAPAIRPVVADGRVTCGVGELDDVLSRHRVAGLRSLGADGLYLLFPDDAAGLVRDLCGVGAVEGAWPDVVVRLDSVPDDSLYRQEWHLVHIGAPGAWNIAHGDSSVKVAVIADAVRWTHPDIEPNLWINAAEDLNGNGRFDPSAPPTGDLDGVDQDANGCTDDVIGYDFYADDPDPSPPGVSDGGTHYLGTANAATDNGIGVSAPPWNVRSIALRCGDNGSVYLSSVIAAIYYLIDQGAWAVSMGFSMTSQYPPLADACLTAWNSGLVPCAPIGNDGSETRRFPAGYDGVIAVASHGRTNMKSPYSNYGDWADITAPGEDIISTVGMDSYEARSGCGAAAGVVVGVLGWVKSAWPEIGRDSALSIVRRMCDTMPDPLYRQGKLGWGRVRMSVPTTGLEQTEGSEVGHEQPEAKVVRGVLFLAESSTYSGTSSLLDLSGRVVMALSPGPNDVSRLAPGVYFVCRPSDIGRVVVTR